MQMRMWMLDVAREQSPTLGDLRRYLDLTRESGYNAIGLYFEHRFAYPSTPWAHGQGCVTPAMVETLQSEYADIQIIPFVNLLGHCEGMLYTEHGKRFREETFKGLQACPCCPEFVELCSNLLDDVMQVFRSEVIHIGGDETWQLGACPRCKARVESVADGDGKAALYADHFGPLARRVQDAGRRPAVWGDMFQDHPSALDSLPTETLIFDWQYFKSPLETSRSFVEKGFQVVCCPAVLTYNALWCQLSETEQNIRDHVAAATEIPTEGVCITTWECGLFGNYETLFPIIRGAGSLLTQPDESRSLLTNYEEESASHGEWARLMSDDLAAIGGMFEHGSIRSSLKCRMLLYSNPFLAWMHHAEELMGPNGERALDIFGRAIAIAPNTSMRGVAEFGKLAVEFVRHAERARQAYAQGLPGVAVSSLTPCRQIFEQLEKIAKATNLNIGGSLADIERCRSAKEHVERVMLRIKEFGDGSLGYLPAFEIITHPKLVPHDQACWWLINKWANE